MDKVKEKECLNYYEKNRVKISKEIRQKQLEKQIEKEGSFEDNFPELLKEWNYEKNNELNVYPNEVTSHSGQKVWWKCQLGHEWNSNISTRTGNRKSGCPICKNKIILEGYNDFASLNKILLREWNYEKNNELNVYPNEVTSHSGKKVWWVCPNCSNEYMATISHRVGGTNCPKCADELRTSFKEQAIYYYLKQYYIDTVNRAIIYKKEIDVFIPSLNLAIEYDGAYYHENQKSLKREKEKYQILNKNGILLVRIKESSKKVFLDNNSDKYIFIENSNDDKSLENAIKELLTFISDKYNTKINVKVDVKADKLKIYEQYIKLRKENSLLKKCPQIAKQWNYEKNGKLTPDMVTIMTAKRVWWKCNNNHEWSASIGSRVQGHGCPYCAGQKVLTGINALETKFPEIAREWNYNKNALNPNEVFPHTNKKYWWICSNGHEYLASPNSRTGYKKTGCLICSNKQVLVGENDFATQNPELLKEWDYERNNSIHLYPTEISSGSNKYAYWKCEKGHKWKAMVNSRTGNKGRNCPVCSGKVIEKGYNDFASHFPILLKEWDYEKNDKINIFPDKITCFSNKKVNWKCLKCKNEWVTSIYHRTSKKTNCPVCSQQVTIKKSIETRLSNKGSFAQNNKELLKEWDYEENDKLNIFPDKITSGSHQHVYWRCKYGHIWKAMVKARTRVNGTGCPSCYSQNKNNTYKT